MSNLKIFTEFHLCWKHEKSQEPVSVRQQHLNLFRRKARAVCLITQFRQKLAQFFHHEISIGNMSKDKILDSTFHCEHDRFVEVVVCV